MKIIKTTLVFCFVMLIANTYAMLDICIKNEMSSNLYIDRFSTSGSVVKNSTEIIGESPIGISKEVNLFVQITSPSCLSKNNYVSVSVDRSEHDIHLRWGKDIIEADSYVINGLCRITQHSDIHGTIIFTFFDDTEIVVKKLLSSVMNRIYSDKNSQTSQGISFIKKHSGLLANELFI